MLTFANQGGGCLGKGQAAAYAAIGTISDINGNVEAFGTSGTWSF